MRHMKTTVLAVLLAAALAVGASASASTGSMIPGLTRRAERLTEWAEQRLQDGGAGSCQLVVHESPHVTAVFIWCEQKVSTR